jgi:hypothetical protein
MADPTEQRLTDLWQRQTNPSIPSDPEQEEIPDRMGVTVTEPMNISGTVLMPGRYIFRQPKPGAQSNYVEIFNQDQTKLVAKIALGGVQFPKGLAGPERSSPLSPKTTRFQ